MKSLTSHTLPLLFQELYQSPIEQSSSAKAKRQRLVKLLIEEAEIEGAYPSARSMATLEQFIEGAITLPRVLEIFARRGLH
ncbi:hypothetical protein MWN52_13605 [Pseudoxanthomonas winnipegensis]|uniref:hypothetical protein n=1 Tax=Pseudoxanthomonas winnipegensis TaxID=2480810 RepID=UPI002574EE3A|nr:hypothetical protein [Pseudoxanthomonas winnipegensis]WJI14656.1 hypothetical protein MWN52_13605 [Pseudoxanthomonas winnipegensis]